MSCSLTFEQWGVLASVGVSVIAVIISISSSNKSDKTACEQVKLTQDLVKWKLEEEISRKETELAKVRAEYEGLKAKVEIEVNNENKNSSSWLDSNEHFIRHQYASQFRSYEDRISQLTDELCELKSRRK